MPETNISPAMQEAVGRQITRAVSYPVSASDIRRWALAVYWPGQPPARYLDEDPAGGLTAPEEFNPFAWAAAELSGSAADDVDANDPDRTELQLGVPGPGLKFQLNGGMETEYVAPMRPGDVITSVRRLGPYTEREGRLGLMLFSTTEDVWTNQHGQMVKRTVNTLIRY